MTYCDSSAVEHIQWKGIFLILKQFSKSTFSGSPSTFKLYPEIDFNPLSWTSLFHFKKNKKTPRYHQHAHKKRKALQQFSYSTISYLSSLSFLFKTTDDGLHNFLTLHTWWISFFLATTALSVWIYIWWCWSKKKDLGRRSGWFLSRSLVSFLLYQVPIILCKR